MGEQTNKKRAQKNLEQYEVGALDSLLEQWCCGAETQRDEQHMPKWKNRPHSFWLTTSTTLSPNTLRLFIFPVPGPEAMCLTRPGLSSNLFIATQHVKKVTKSPFFFFPLSSRSQSGACCTSDPFCTAGIRGGEQTTIWRKSRDTLHREGVIGGRNGSAEVSEW